MNLLGVNTSSSEGSVALYVDGELRGEVVSESAVSFSRSLLGMMRALLETHDVALDRLSGIGVALGPGSFTGIRIGLATLQGVALSRGFPVYGVSTLEAMAVVAPATEGVFTVALSAGAGNVYHADFAHGADGPVRHSDDAFGPSDTLSKGGVPVVMQNREGNSDGLRSSDSNETALRHSIAAGVADAAYRRLRAGEKGALAFLKPNYIRRSAAERERDGGK